VTSASTVPLWLVHVHGVDRGTALIGWTLAAFSLSSARGGIVAGLLAPRVGRRLLVGGSMLLAPLPLFALFQLEPGGPAYFAMAALGGVLVNAGLPLKIVTAQELAPRAVAAASGMLMGFAMGIAGLLYIGVGVLQEAMGLVPAAAIAYSALVPAALLAFTVLGRRQVAAMSESVSAIAVALTGSRCSCWYAEGPPVARYPADVDATRSRHGARSACAASTGDDPSACGIRCGDRQEERAAPDGVPA
jgi:MFS family permease